MTKYTILLFLFAFYLSSESIAQQPVTDTVQSAFTFTPDDFKNFHLPPLQTLFENARRNPRLEAIQASIEAAKSEVKLAKRDWLNYFSVRAGYTYGILGIYTDSETKYTPLTTTYSGSTQNSWSVGANVSIPFDQLLNHKLRVKRQQQLVKNAEYTKEIAFNEVKSEIVELYSNIQYRLKMLEAASESITLYESDYSIAKSEFINNQLTPTELSALKDSQRKAKEEYHMIVSQLNMLLLKLEILTNTKLISKPL